MRTKRFHFYACLLGIMLLHAFVGRAQTVTNVAAGAAHSLFLKSDGSLWGMGKNSAYQLGTGNQSNAYSPILLVASNVVAIEGGGNIHNGDGHSMFIKSDGSLWVMGENGYGQLGNGSFVDQTVPEQIKSDEITGIAAGDGHSLFLDGTGLWVMGYNAWGQLGNSSYLSPAGGSTQQVVFNGVTAVAAGGAHSLFLKSDGSLWAMGDNFRGQLGNGTNTSGAPLTGFNQPQLIVSSNVTIIAAGYYHSLFIKNDGSLWGMGQNGSGELGNGISVGTNRPILIVASNVTAIAAGANHSLFIKSDGSLWGMGANVPLGTNGLSFTNPICMVGSGVVAIAAGDQHSLFVKSDGSLWGMGGNSSGQVGDGTFNPSIIPPKLIVPGTGYHRITGTMLTGGDMQLAFEGSAGASYVLERTFSLSPANWLPLVTNSANQAGSLVFTNTPNPATNNFWRIRSTP